MSEIRSLFLCSFRHFVIIIPLRTNWVSEIRSLFLCSFRHFVIIIPLRTNWVSEIRSLFLCSFRHFVIIIPLRTNWVSEIRSLFLCSFRHFAIFHCEQTCLLAVTFTIYSLCSIFLKTVKIYFINKDLEEILKVNIKFWVF